MKRIEQLSSSICVSRNKNLVPYLLSVPIQWKPGERSIPAALWLAHSPAITNRDMSLSSQSQAAISLSFPVKMVSDCRYPKNRTFFKCWTEDTEKDAGKCVNGWKEQVTTHTTLLSLGMEKIICCGITVLLGLKINYFNEYSHEDTCNWSHYFSFLHLVKSPPCFTAVWLKCSDIQFDSSLFKHCYNQNSL